jgi:hypothetical protein
LLASWRLQLLTQLYVTDKNYRRPFKLTRGPLSFVATDMGASTWVLEDTVVETLKAKNGTAIPSELRKRLAEIGFAFDIEAVDQKAELIKTPISLLPSQHLDRVDSSGESISLSRPPSPSPDADVNYSNISRQPAVKRRPIFVHALAGVLSELAHLAMDDDYSVFGAARSTLLTLMRDDPTILARPIFDHYAEGDESIRRGVTILQRLTHIQRVLPPGMSHSSFNYVCGFLKTTAKRHDASFAAFAFSMPVLASLVAQVSSLSIRDIRRSKVDMFLVPSGALWFPASAPVSTAFPRSLNDATHTGRTTAKEALVQITMVRTAQNLLFLRLLQRHPHDVSVIRKHMTPLVLPSMNDTFDFAASDMHAYIPRKPGTTTTKVRSSGELMLSLVLSRSYLLLVEAVFRSMPRHLNDRSELAVLVDGLNKILLVHGDDIGIVGHVLIGLSYFMGGLACKGFDA